MVRRGGITEIAWEDGNIFFSEIMTAQISVHIFVVSGVVPPKFAS